jgi:hypothetical protein
MSEGQPSVALRPLALALLQALVDDEKGQEGISLPRLSKHLGQSASAVLREAHALSDAVMGGQRGPGWVRVWQQEGRWMVRLVACDEA